MDCYNHQGSAPAHYDTETGAKGHIASLFHGCEGGIWNNRVTFLHHVTDDDSPRFFLWYILIHESIF